MNLVRVFFGISFGLIIGCTSQNEGLKSEAEHAIRLMYKNLYETSAMGSSLDYPEQFYSEKLASLIKRDQQLQEASGELGLLSADPLCECQDPSGLVIEKITATVTKEDSAIAVVDLSVGGREQKLHLDLTKIHEKWRIDDVKTSEVKSLRLFLENGSNLTESRPALPTPPAN